MKQKKATVIVLIYGLPNQWRSKWKILKAFCQS